MFRSRGRRRRGLLNKIKKLLHVNSNSNDDGLDDLREQMLNAIDVPLELVCGITYDLPKTPVITPNGQMYDEESIVEWIAQHGNCPITRQPLTVENLMRDECLSELMRGLRDSVSALTKDIARMTNKNRQIIENSIKIFLQHVELAKQDVPTILDKYRQHYLICCLRDKLKLDINNPEHIAYWLKRTNPGFDKCVQIYVMSMAREIVLPKIVVKMMKIAQSDYKTLDEFKSVLNNYRRGVTLVPRFFDQPLQSLVAKFARDPAGAEIINADTLDRVKLT